MSEAILKELYYIRQKINDVIDSVSGGATSDGGSAERARQVFAPKPEPASGHPEYIKCECGKWARPTKNSKPGEYWCNTYRGGCGKNTWHNSPSRIKDLPGE